MIRVFYKVLREIYFKIHIAFCWVCTYTKFILNGVSFTNDFKAYGVPIINVNLRGNFNIGAKFKFHSGKYYNMIGRQHPCYFIVGANANLVIGSNVGLSCTALICHKEIVIGDNVKFGGNVVVYDTDFHSISACDRNANPENLSSVLTKSVHIRNGAFIGAHSIILKGVTIGENSIVGAGSVVSKDVPQNQIWGGNPCKFIRENYT